MDRKSEIKTLLLQHVVIYVIQVTSSHLNGTVVAFFNLCIISEIECHFPVNWK